MSLSMVGAKVSERTLSSFDEFENDVLTLVRNAEAYYEPGSPLHSRAGQLRDCFTACVADVATGVNTPRALTMRTLYDAVVAYTEPESGRALSQQFMALPSSGEFPEYFEVVETPLSLLTVRSCIPEFASLADFRDALCAVFNDALLFYPSDSSIYADARTLRAFVLDAYRDLVRKARGEVGSGGGDDGSMLGRQGDAAASGRLEWVEGDRAASKGVGGCGAKPGCSASCTI